MKDNHQHKDSIADQEQMDAEKAAGMSINSDENMAGTHLLDDELTDNTTPEEVAQLQKELDQLKDAHLRLNADFENYRKRMAKERLELMQNAGAEVMRSLLEVLDDSDRSLSMMEKSDDVNQLKEGVRLVFHKMNNILSAQGLRRIDAKDKDFNTDEHEAITEIEAGHEKAGKVVDVVSPGYYLNDKMLRHAKVVVGK